VFFSSIIKGEGKSVLRPCLIQGIYVIADNSITPHKSHLEIAKSALDGGAKIIQLRAKNLSKRQFYKVAQGLARLVENYGALLIVNDDLPIALEVGAGGVHLGADDLPVPEAKKLAPNLIIGRSTHSLEEAMEVEKIGADYIAFGAIFPTTTKGRPTPIQGIEKLKEVCLRIKRPVVAIGGIKRENLAQIKQAGAASAAFISEVVCADNISERVRELIKFWERKI